MHIGVAAQRRLRTTTVLFVVALAVAIFSYLWAKSGGTIPFVTGHGYKLEGTFTNIENLAPAGDVEMAGVPIGTIASVTPTGGQVKVDMVLHRNAPLHRGATLQIAEKTLVGETYVQVVDGHGPVLPSGTSLPISADKNYTSINTLLDSFNAPTRQQASKLIDELDAATKGQGGNLGEILAGLATVGRQGGTVVDVLANQTPQLQTLVHQTAALLGALDEGQGQIADLTTTAEKVSAATAAEQGPLGQTIADLTPVVDSAQAATGSIVTLSDALAPIASDLRTAAPVLDQALITLPGTTANLRALMGPLGSALTAAPATLGPLPGATADLTALSTPTAGLLTNLDPIVAYLAPYHRDVAAFFDNFAGAISHTDGIGKFGEPEALPGMEALGGNGNPLFNQAVNATPAPGVGASDPLAPQGAYPHVLPAQP